MGVDFFPCHYCKESICDCGSYTRCRCGRKWCSDECAEKEGYRSEDQDRFSVSCSFCRMEDVEDSALVEFLLRKLNITRARATLLYFGDYPEDDDSSSSV